MIQLEGYTKPYVDMLQAGQVVKSGSPFRPSMLDLRFVRDRLSVMLGAKGALEHQQVVSIGWLRYRRSCDGRVELHRVKDGVTFGRDIEAPPLSLQ